MLSSIWLNELLRSSSEYLSSKPILVLLLCSITWRQNSFSESSWITALGSAYTSCLLRPGPGSVITLLFQTCFLLKMVHLLDQNTWHYEVYYLEITFNKNFILKKFCRLKFSILIKSSWLPFSGSVSRARNFCVDINLEYVISISNMCTFKFEDQCLTPQSKLYLIL